jgi:hypothetical protein
VTRPECMEPLIREHGFSVTVGMQGSCCGGHLAVAQWLVATFGLAADEARDDNNLALDGSCILTDSSGTWLSHSDSRRRSA